MTDFEREIWKNALELAHVKGYASRTQKPYRSIQFFEGEQNSGKINEATNITHFPYDPKNDA